MRSELYNGLLAEGRLDPAGGKDKYFWVDGMEWLSPDEAAIRKVSLQEYWREVDEVFAEALEGYELYAINAAGDPWLEDKKSGRTSFLPYDSPQPFPRHEYNSVEAAVFVRLLNYAAESIEYLDMSEEELRAYFVSSADICENYFPHGWIAELRRIAELPLENDSLLTDDRVKQIRDALCI